MIDLGKKSVLGMLMSAIDYEATVRVIIRAAIEGRGLSVSALAVHGLMIGVLEPEHRYRLNLFDLLVPDGQPVRWALNLLHGTGLPDRVYGANLMLAVCEQAEREGLPIYCYGSTEDTLMTLRSNLLRRFPRMRIAGAEPSRFRRLSVEEKHDLVFRIRATGASILFLGLGCPRQEVWAYEFRDALSMPILAVGAAFPFLAEKIPQAPRWAQDHGLEWLFRLWTEPRRLWRRYLVLNPLYILFVALQAARLWQFPVEGRKPESELLYG